MIVDCYWDDHEAMALDQLFPILIDPRVRIFCPGENCPWAGSRFMLQGLIGHLNDDHQWPRCEKDRNEQSEGLPTIMGWLKEAAEKNGWDLTCRTM